MDICCLLSKDHLKLAIAEAQSLVNQCPIILSHDLILFKNLTLEKVNFISNRAALVKSTHQYLFSCKTPNLEVNMESFDWKKVYENDFSVTVHKEKDQTFNSSEKKLASFIWNKVKEPKVNLKQSNTPITIFVRGENSVATILLKKNNQHFNSRRSHLLPFFHSGAIHPKLARACVNLSGIQKNQRLHDPFCGTGGFLIEAGLMEFPITGSDLNEKMVWGCMENLNFFKIKNCYISIQDALTLSKKIDYVVADLPYGLNSIGIGKENLSLKHNKNSVAEIEEFYAEFLTTLYKVLIHKSILVFPHYVKYKKLLKSASFTITQEFSVYIHRSLKRKIVCVSKDTPHK